jgi:hypothetical protein
MWGFLGLEKAVLWTKPALFHRKPLFSTFLPQLFHRNHKSC